MQVLDLKARAEALNSALTALEQYPWEALPVAVAAPIEAAAATLRAEFDKAYSAYREAIQLNA